MKLHPAVMSWLSRFAPPPTRVSHTQRILAATGAFIGIGLTALICGAARQHFASAWWMAAPLGASAVQVFSIPGSPLSQPWPVIAGNMLSALAGVLCFHIFGSTTLGAASAVGLAALLMLMTRSLHASGGGTALMMILTGTGDPSFILFPVAANAVCLVVAAMAFHRFSGHLYPQAQMIEARPHQLALHRFERADLEAVLKRYNAVIAISREELEGLIDMTELAAYERMAGPRLCADIMEPLPAGEKGAGVPSGAMNAPLSSLPAMFASESDLERVMVTDGDGRPRGVITRAGLMGALFANDGK